MALTGFLLEKITGKNGARLSKCPCSTSRQCMAVSLLRDLAVASKQNHFVLKTKTVKNGHCDLWKNFLKKLSLPICAKQRVKKYLKTGYLLLIRIRYCPCRYFPMQ